MPWLWWWCPRVLVSEEHDTWHETWGAVTLPRWSPLPRPRCSCFISPWRHAPPLCSLRLLWFSVSITSSMTRRICFSKYLGISRLLFCQNKHVIHVMVSAWPGHEPGCTGGPESLSSDEMSPWRGARVIYSGLESAKLSRSRVQPPDHPETQTQSNSQKHEH